MLLSASVLAAQTSGGGRTAIPRTSPPANPSSSPGGARSVPPPVGTLGPAAARALSGRPARSGLSTGIAPFNAITAGRNGRPLGIGGYVPLSVIDAPVYQRGGSTLGVVTVSPPVVSEPAFYPTMQPPTWRVVPEERPVQAWRVVDVTDVVCNPQGGCSSVTTRMLARWAPAMRAYAFRDRVGRIWQVE
ncbi:MAG: hypothetical protein ACO1Q7_10285 [Gemmatimonas sp.]